MKEVFEALKDYLDKRFEYEFAQREVGADGHFPSCVSERKDMEQAWERLLLLIKVV